MGLMQYGGVFFCEICCGTSCRFQHGMTIRKQIHGSAVAISLKEAHFNLRGL